MKYVTRVSQYCLINSEHNCSKQNTLDLFLNKSPPVDISVYLLGQKLIRDKSIK